MLPFATQQVGKGEIVVGDDIQRLATQVFGSRRSQLGQVEPFGALALSRQRHGQATIGTNPLQPAVSVLKELDGRREHQLGPRKVALVQEHLTDECGQLGIVNLVRRLEDPLEVIGHALRILAAVGAP